MAQRRISPMNCWRPGQPTNSQATNAARFSATWIPAPIARAPWLRRSAFGRWRERRPPCGGARGERIAGGARAGAAAGCQCRSPCLLPSAAAGRRTCAEDTHCAKSAARCLEQGRRAGRRAAADRLQRGAVQPSQRTRASGHVYLYTGAEPPDEHPRQLGAGSSRTGRHQRCRGRQPN